MNNERIEEILNVLAKEEVPADVRKIAEETSRDCSRTFMQSRQPRRHFVLEVIMKSQITKLAAAAAIVVAVLIGLNIFPTGKSGVAWADLVEHVEQIKTVMYRMTATMKGLPGLPQEQSISIDMNAKMAYDSGFRIDSCTYVENKEIRTNSYILFEEGPDKGAIITVIPKEKKYIKMKLTEELLAKMEKENGDPRTMLKEMMKYKYTPLGRDTIDGIKVEGIEVTDPNMALRGGGMFDELAARLWCNVETDLPVRMTIKGSAKNGEVVMDMVMDSFQWDVPIDTAELQPNIPADYELLAEARFGGGTKDAGEIVEALKFFAEIADGRYPSSLTGMTVMMEFADAMQVQLARQPSSDGPSKEVMAKIVKLQGIGMTYASMVQDGNDPAYYGDKVTAEFPHAVLMRWKISDNTYRVIFGDLSIGQAATEEMAKLESAPLNTKPKAVKPRPADGTVGTPLTGIKLSWIAGAYVTEHKVYFGTNSDELPLLADLSDACAVGLPALERQTTYYWRVDEVQPDGSVVTGDLWSFDTGRLVAWWKLDDGSGNTAVDSSGNGLAGSVAGNPSWTAGMVGGALKFDGDGDYVDIGKDPKFNITNQITIAAWIKVDAFDREWQTIISKGDGSWRLQRNWDKGTLEFGCTGLAVPGNRWGGIYSYANVNDGQWHHAAGVYDGQKLNLYVDGSLDASADVKGAINVNDYLVLIGENAEKPQRFWEGLIDDVRIYSYGLNAEEIAEIFKGSLKGQ
jgi:hypothetical protein